MTITWKRQYMLVIPLEIITAAIKQAFRLFLQPMGLGRWKAGR